ncbi:DMT family transporter [Neobacillus sp. NPDC097160]|uniref:DMT family transporter n=1 Tax=Neobacillus sp. NPDC097160 TaxID=3364298 RepID=UPI003819E8DE
MNSNLNNHSGDRKKLLLGIIIMLIAATLFGTLGTLTNLAVKAGLSPVSFAMWRELFGTISLIILLAFGIGKPPKADRTPLSKIPRNQIRNLIIASIAFSAYSLAMFYAFVELSVALAMLLFYTFPAIVTIICAVTGVERLNSPKLIALILSLGGGALAVIGQLFGQSVQISTLGIALALGAALGMSVFYMIGRSGYQSLPPTYATTFFLAAGSIVFAICGLAFGEGATLIAPFVDASAYVWFILIFAGLAGAAIPTMLMVTSIRMIGASRASTMQIFEPVVAAILAAIFLAQPIYTIQIIGGALIIIAAFILQRKTKEPSIELPLSMPDLEARKME